MVEWKEMEILNGKFFLFVQWEQRYVEEHAMRQLGIVPTSVSKYLFLHCILITGYKKSEIILRSLEACNLIMQKNGMRKCYAINFKKYLILKVFITLFKRLFYGFVSFSNSFPIISWSFENSSFLDLLLPFHDINQQSSNSKWPNNCILYWTSTQPLVLQRVFSSLLILK